MIVLSPNEKILLEGNSSITIKYKPKGEEKGKGIFYITTFRLVFENTKKGIMMQVFPSKYELQAYRISKSLLGREKLVLDIEKRVEDKSILALIEIEMKNLKEVEKALKVLLNASNYNMNEESMNKKNTKEYKELDVPILEGQQVMKLIHDVDVEHYDFDELEEVDKKAKMLLTSMCTWVFTKGGVERIVDEYCILKTMDNIVEVYIPNRAGKSDILSYRLTFSNNEDAKYYVNHIKSRDKHYDEMVKKYGKGFQWKLKQDRVAIVKTEGYDDVIVREIK